MDVRGEDVALDGDVRDRGERHPVLVLRELLLFREDRVLLVVGEDAEVDRRALLVRVALAFLLAPLAAAERVEDDLNRLILGKSGR